MAGGRSFWVGMGAAALLWILASILLSMSTPRPVDPYYERAALDRPQAVLPPHARRKNRAAQAGRAKVLRPVAGWLLFAGAVIAALTAVFA